MTHPQPPSTPTASPAAAGLSPEQRELFEVKLRAARAALGRSDRIPRRPDDGPAPLSWSQELFFFIEAQEGVPSVYRTSRYFEIEGAVDSEALAAAFRYLGRRHDILRTRFGARPAEPLPETFQVVDRAVELELEIEDLRQTPEDERQARALETLRAWSRKPFDLSQPPLLRPVLVHLDDQRHHLLLAMHHMIVDGWSLGLLLQELGQAYEAYRTGREPGLPKPSIQYADYALWERQRVQGPMLEELMAYWAPRLADGLPQLDLPTDRPRPETSSFRGALRGLPVPEEISRHVKERSRAEGVSEYMLFLAAYKTLLAHASEQDDILVGSPHANRAGSQAEELLGCFINLLMLRTDLSGDPTVRELLGRVKETALGAYAHAEMPFLVIASQFAPPDHPPDKPPFQALFTFQNTLPPSLELAGVRVSPPRIVDRGSTDLDLTLSVEDVAGSYVLAMLYDPDLFDEARVDDLLGTYRGLLEEMAHHPERRLSELADRRQ